MDFAFTDEQEALREGVRTVLDTECTPDALRAFELADEAGRVEQSQNRWAVLAELGAPALVVPEAADGLGLSDVDLVGVLEEAGRAGLPEPLLETAALAAPTLAALLPDAAATAALAALVRDDVSFAVGGIDVTPGGVVSPTEVSAAEMEATWAISVLPSTSLACLARFSTAALTAFSMPRFSPVGLAPAATLRSPSLIRAWASTVAVVVPSPATSLVLVATSFTSWAPMFSKTSSSSTSRAMDTPSLVMVGAPNFFSMTTLRPLGPRVTLTTSASLFTPASRPRRAASSNLRIFGITWTPWPARHGSTGSADPRPRR